MRKKVMAFNAKVNAWILKRLKGVWLDPIFCAIFAIMCVASIIGALHLHRDTLYYSALIWAFVMLCPRVFAGIFTPDAELIEFTGRALRIYCAVLAIFGIQQACQITFVSIGKAVCSIIVAVMRKFVLLIPLIYLLPHLVPDPTLGVYLAEPVADTLAVTFTSILFSHQFRKALRTLESERGA